MAPKAKDPKDKPNEESSSSDKDIQEIEVEEVSTEEKTTDDASSSNEDSKDVDAAVDSLIDELKTADSPKDEDTSTEESVDSSKDEDTSTEESVDSSKDKEVPAEESADSPEEPAVNDSPNTEDTKEDSNSSDTDTSKDEAETTDTVEEVVVTKTDSVSGDEIVEKDTAVVSEVQETTPTTTTQPDASQVGSISTSTATPSKKKSKAPIIIVLLLLIAAIGGLITWFVLRSAPEVQVTDAITNFLTAKQISTSGTINLKFDQAANPDIRSVKLDLGVASERVPASTTATLSITTQSNSTFKLDLGEAIAKDGAIYLKISGLQKAINSAKVPDEVQIYLDYFSDIIRTIDDQWWMISVPDLISQANSSSAGEVINPSYADVYQCIINEATKNDGSEISEIYKKYPFIDVEKYTGNQLQPVNGGTVFGISVNKSQLTNFENELKNSNVQKAFNGCLSKANISTDSSGQISSVIDEFAKISPAYIEVSGFTHQLSRFYATREADDIGSIEIDLSFSFPETVSIDIPTKSRAITELINSIVDDLEYMLYDIYNGYYTTNNTVDCRSDANCIENVRTN